MLPAINQAEAIMATGEAGDYVPYIHRCEIMRGVIERMPATGHVLPGLRHTWGCGNGERRWP
jgi:hypothetical protein